MWPFVSDFGGRGDTLSLVLSGTGRPSNRTLPACDQRAAFRRVAMWKPVQTASGYVIDACKT
eukprot:1759848-Rhodomonas_salina.2